MKYKITDVAQIAGVSIKYIQNMMNRRQVKPFYDADHDLCILESELKYFVNETENLINSKLAAQQCNISMYIFKVIYCQLFNVKKILDNDLLPKSDVQVIVEKLKQDSEELTPTKELTRQLGLKQYQLLSLVKSLKLKTIRNIFGKNALNKSDVQLLKDSLNESTIVNEKRYTLKEYIERIGITESQFRSKMQSKKFKANLKQDTKGRYYFTDEDIKNFKINQAFLNIPL